MTSSPISFGDAFPAGIENFKTAFANLKPRIGSCLWLVAPVVTANLVQIVLFEIILFAVAPSESGGSPDGGIPALAGIAALFFWLCFFLLCIPPGLYCGFCFLRFIAQATANPSQQFTLKSLYAYDSSLWGFTGLYWIVSIVGSAAVVMTCGLGSPFFIAFLYCSLFSFLDSPSSGIEAALSRGWSLATKDWKRWLAMWILTFAALISLYIIMLPVLLLSAVPIIGALFLLLFATVCVACVFYASVVPCCTYRDSAASVG